MPSSRPIPEQPKPPRDTAGCSAKKPSPVDVAKTAPARILFATLIALDGLEDITVEANPKAVELASIMASSSLEKDLTEITGPNISFCQASESRGTSIKMVGWTKYPPESPTSFASGALPPVKNVMPAVFDSYKNLRFFYVGQQTLWVE